jgi:hypothetical protein
MSNGIALQKDQRAALGSVCACSRLSDCTLLCVRALLCVHVLLCVFTLLCVCVRCLCVCVDGVTVTAVEFTAPFESR